MLRILQNSVTVFLVVVFIAHPSLAVNLISGDVVVIDYEVKDVIVSGGRINVLAPVNGDLIAAGGDVIVNSPVSGDVIVSGGRVEINGNVGGKIIGAGGDMRINGEVKKFVIVAGGNVDIGKRAKINDDVFMAGGKIINNGYINGNLTAVGGEYSGYGEITGKEYFKKAQMFPQYFFDAIIAGVLIPGFILLYMFPGLFQKTHNKISGEHKQILLALIAGAMGLTFFTITGMLLLFTLIGTVTGIFLIMLTIILIFISNLTVSHSIGKIVIRKRSENRYFNLFVGFAILFILSKIPYAGGFILLISTFLGSGSILLSIWDMKSENGFK